MQSPGWQPTSYVAWCGLIWWFANLEKYGHTWHWMSFLKPAVIKQPEPKLLCMLPGYIWPSVNHTLILLYVCSLHVEEWIKSLHKNHFWRSLIHYIVCTCFCNFITISDVACHICIHKTHDSFSKVTECYEFVHFYPFFNPSMWSVGIFYTYMPHMHPWKKIKMAISFNQTGCP